MYITEKQRKFIFVLLRQYKDEYRFTLEEAKDILKISFCQLKDKEYFSLSNCKADIASEFINFIKNELES